MKRLAGVAIAIAIAASIAHGQVASPRVVADADALTIGETFTLRSAALGETRRINVYLPGAYADSSRPRFDVLYMPDGGMAEDFLHVAGLLQVSIGNGTMRPMILVGIENTQRRRDLTGPTTVASDLGIAPTVGGSAAFRAFLRTELIPEVIRRYRVTDVRAIMGESLAGLFVVETFFEEPALFDAYVAFDPSLWWNGGALVRDAARRLPAGVGRGKALYLASSNEPDIARRTGELAAILRQHGPPSLTWWYDPMPNETHSTIYHPAALRAVRRVFTAGAVSR